MSESGIEEGGRGQGGEKREWDRNGQRRVDEQCEKESAGRGG